MWKLAACCGMKSAAWCRRGKTVLLTTHYLQEADALADRIAVINQGKIIAEGTPSEIKAQTSGKKIRCITSLSADALRRLPGVREVHEDRNAVEIHAAEAEAIVRELLALDAGLTGLEISSAGLEEAFLALTHDTGGCGGLSRADAAFFNREADHRKLGEEYEHRIHHQITVKSRVRRLHLRVALSKKRNTSS